MKFVDFKTKLDNTRVIDLKNVVNLFDGLDHRRLYEWQKKGYIRRLTNNYYVFTDTNIDDTMLKMIANTIYSPSYIGLESALSYYALIPEAVFQITSVTSKKTRDITTDIAGFKYRSIHKRFFWGYDLEHNGTHTFFVSDPDKTILDYLYLNPHLSSAADFEELRFNRTELQKILDPARLKNYLALFSHKRLAATIKKMLKVLNVEL